MARSMNAENLQSALSALGEVLASRGLRYEVVIVGGANLLLRGVITRSTKDGDVVGGRSPDGQVTKMPRLLRRWPPPCGTWRAPMAWLTTG